MGREGAVRRRRIAASLIAASSCALACSLTTSFDGLTGGTPEPDADTGDGGGRAETGAPPFDAAVDAGASPDGALDAGADSAPPQRWCVQHPAMFCEDFDDPSGTWSATLTKYVTGGATLGLDTTTSRSAPGSMTLTTDGTTKEGATLTFATPADTAVHKVSFAYDLRIDAYGDYAEIGYVHFSSNGNDLHAHYLRLFPADPWVLGSEAYLPDGGIPQQEVTSVPPVPVGKWVRVAVTIDLVASSTTISVDGVVATRGIDPSLFTPADARVSIGFGYTPNDDTTWAAHFDDVTFDWQ